MTLPPPPPRPVVSGRPIHRGVWIGAALGVLGVVAAGVWAIATLPSVSDDIDRLHRASPGAPAEFTVEDAVDWDVFLEPSTLSQSGVRIEVVDERGDPVPLGNEHGFTYEWFGRSGRSIASVALDPGTYRMRVVEGTATVAVGASPGWAILRAVGGAVLIALLVCGPGVVILVVSAVRDTRRRTRDAEPPPPSPWSAGEWPAAEPPVGSGR